VTDEGVLDPWVAAWLEANPMTFEPSEDLQRSRPNVELPVTRELNRVTDDVVAGVPVRIYEGDGRPTGLIVYFHGGGWCVGSVALMDNVARELAHASGAVVVSVEYRLAPEYPYPAGLDDCDALTRWALANASRFGVAPSNVVVAGESAGGNLAAAVTLRLRGDLDVPLAGQVLVYPGVDHGSSSSYPSRAKFTGLVVNKTSMDWYWASYTAGRDLADDPFVAPARAASLTGVPPALVILGGCDFLRDEGRHYAARLRESNVEVDEACYPGQPHGFVNFGFPAAGDAFDRIGRWVRARFGSWDRELRDRDRK